MLMMMIGVPASLFEDMSRIQDPHKAFFPHGNPFRMILPKGSLSPKLFGLLNKFEETLAGRLRKLIPGHKYDVLCFTWMLLAMQLLSETHNDIKSLIAELELPIYDWNEKWIDVYLDNSVKLLDICNGFSSELSRLNQGQLLLRIISRHLEGQSSDELLKAKASIDSWRHHISAGNPRIDNCFPIIDKLMESLEFPKVKNSSKGKVLMRAMYGLRMQTLFVCSIFLSAFTCSGKKLINLQVSGTPLWAKAFSDLQSFVHGEIRNLVSNHGNVFLKELEAVDSSIKELFPLFEQEKEPVNAETFQSSVAELRTRTDKLSSGIDLLAKEVDEFFQVVLSGRDALLCNLRVPGSAFDSPKKYKREGQLVQ